MTIAESLINQTRQLTLLQKREVLARLWNEDELGEAGRIWKSIRFTEKLRVVAHAPEQESFVGGLREILLKGALARIENEDDGTAEI